MGKDYFKELYRCKVRLKYVLEELSKIKKLIYQTDYELEIHRLEEEIKAMNVDLEQEENHYSRRHVR